MNQNSLEMSSAQVVQSFEQLFSRFGLPEVAASNNGPQFVSEKLKSYFKMHAIIPITSPFYHAPSNGQAERFVQIVKKRLKCTTVLCFTVCQLS